MTNNKVAMNDEQLDQVTGGTSLPYRVQPGDSLESIARKFKVSPEQLMRWNNLQGTSQLQVNQQLRILF